jgi:hypothetical protein
MTSLQVGDYWLWSLIIFLIHMQVKKNCKIPMRGPKFLFFCNSNKVILYLIWIVHYKVADMTI